MLVHLIYLKGPQMLCCDLWLALLKKLSVRCMNIHMWTLMMFQNQVLRTATSIYFPTLKVSGTWACNHIKQILWGVVTCPYPWYKHIFIHLSESVRCVTVELPYTPQRKHIFISHVYSFKPLDPSWTDNWRTGAGKTYVWQPSIYRWSQTVPSWPKPTFVI